MQAIAHFLQAAAQLTQHSFAENFSHSAPQAVQMSEHNWHISLQYAESLAQNRAHKAHTSAQSRHNAMHLKWSFSAMPMHIVAHFSHSIIHAIHAAMHSCMLWVFFTFSMPFMSCVFGRTSISFMPFMPSISVMAAIASASFIIEEFLEKLN